MVPRLPIPNRTVKRLSADDSVVLPCESRSPPNTYSKPLTNVRGLFHGSVKSANSKRLQHRTAPARNEGNGLRGSEGYRNHHMPEHKSTKVDTKSVLLNYFRRPKAVIIIRDSVYLKMG